MALSGFVVPLSGFNRIRCPQSPYYAINTAEAFFAILKRGVMGSFHSISEQHLERYVAEFAFRWNARSALGIEDAERARMMVKGAVGKRLKYRQAGDDVRVG